MTDHLLPFQLKFITSVCASKNPTTTAKGSDMVHITVCKCKTALSEPEICYVLDGILFLYGVILTALYCRIKIYNAREASNGKGKSKQNVEEGIYTGLTPHKQDTYETIGMKK